MRDHFGVAYFTYHRIDLAGNYSVLLDRPDWAERYVEEKFFLLDPYLRHPSVYESGLCSWDSNGTEPYKEMASKAGKDFHLDLSIQLIEKQADCVEFFGFAGNLESSNLDKIYLNHPQLLRAFAAYFKKETADLQRAMQDMKFSLPKHKGTDFYCKDPIHPKLDLLPQEDYFKQLGMKDDLARSLTLTERERQCLKLLVAGHSAKTTAATLHLSPRTVESYFETLKTKLRCFNKQELFALAKKFEELGLLP